ncbi:MAG: hypothetical protein AAF206_17875 [Bacteroidota bacterium]
MRGILLICTFLVVLHLEADECYKCAFDMTMQELCLLNEEEFEFYEKTVFEKAIEIKGNYEKEGDTLIFNKGIDKKLGHEFENELKLIKRKDTIFYLYKGDLSPLYFTKKE